MKKWRTLLGLLGIVGALIISSPSLGFGAQGVTDDMIIMGSIQDLSGPLALVGTQQSHGMGLYFKKVNDEGGINGRKVRFILEDDGYQVPRAVAAYRKLMGQDRIFALLGCSGTASLDALVPLIQKDKLPTFLSAGGMVAHRIPPKRYLFHTSALYGDQGRVVVQYVMEALAKGKKPKIGHITMDDAGGQSYEEGVLDAMGKYGSKLVVDTTAKRGSVDFSAQVAKLRESQPEYVILSTPMRESAAILNEVKKFTWNPEPVFVLTAWATENVLFGLVDPNDRFVKNLIGTSFVGLEDGNNPGSIEYMSCIKKYDPNFKFTKFDLWGYGIGRFVAEGIKKAGRDLTQEKFVDAIESMKNYDAGGIFSPLNFSPTDRVGTKGTFFLKVENGRFVKCSEWLFAK